mmetsp:Transcript_3034/g.5824  ORF Transcript_3034/g.5824 Transcript_3034/m.5824 type:complete len:466 (+) Transcript_3034:302-1699(+)
MEILQGWECATEMTRFTSFATPIVWQHHPGQVRTMEGRPVLSLRRVRRCFYRSRQFVPIAVAEVTPSQVNTDSQTPSRVLGIPTTRLLTWGGAAACAALLRPFFGLALGTFFIGYIGNSFAVWVQRRSDGRIPRRVIVAAFYLSIVVIISAFTVLTIPVAVREAQDFLQTLQSANPYVFVADAIRRTVGDDMAENIEKVVTISMGELHSSRRLEVSDKLIRQGSAIPQVWTEERSRKLGMLLQAAASGYVKKAASVLTKVISLSTKLVFKAIVALVFSFLFVWDLPKIRVTIASLRASRLQPTYEELAPVLGSFFEVLGKSFEAQSMIALVNTSLTTLGIFLLRLPGLWFLSIVVLVCSFIPVAGVFLSTLPMVIVALAEDGVSKAAVVVGMVLAVHALEAYVLNPQIYSAHLKLSPLLVLIVMYLAEHLFGIAGLLLAVPLTVFVLRYIYAREPIPLPAVDPEL